jgi:DNA-binding Xre family transcriptional regulator
LKVKHRLRVLMAQNNVRSMRELSELTGIETFTLYNFDTYVHKKLDPKIIVAICQALKCDISDLLYLEKEIS